MRNKTAPHEGATLLRFVKALGNCAAALLCVLAIVLSASRAEAQTCETQGVCNELAIGEITQQRVGMALAGGNPVPGASSTLGMRLGTLPRISVGVRTTGLQLTIPNPEFPSSSDELSSFIRSSGPCERLKGVRACSAASRSISASRSAKGRSSR